MRHRIIFRTAPVLCFALGASSYGAIIGRFDAGTLSLSDGSPVTSWPSTAGSATLAASGAAAPTYRSGGMNDRPSVDFDGTNDVMTSAGFSNARTVLAVTIADPGSTAIQTLITASNGEQGSVRLGFDPTTYLSGAAGDSNDFYKHDGAETGEDGVYVNNVENGSFTQGASHIVLSQTEAPFTYAGFRLGSSTGFGRFWNGDVSEVIIFDQVLTADERAGVFHNLSVKWNFDSPLPATPEQRAAADAVGVTVPEPAALTIFAAAALGLVRRRVRRAVSP